MSQQKGALPTPAACCTHHVSQPWITMELSTHLTGLGGYQSQWDGPMMGMPARWRSAQRRWQSRWDAWACISQAESMPQLDETRFLTTKLLQPAVHLWPVRLKRMRVLLICLLRLI